MINIITKKRLTFALIIFAMVIFETLLPSPTLGDRSICVGFALDAADDGQILLSVQVIHPMGGNGAQNQNEYSVVSAKGRTLQEAFTNINTSMASVISYAHSVVIFLGNDFLKTDIVPTLRFMLTSEHITDDTFLIGCEGTALSELSKQPVLGECSSIAIQSILQHSYLEKGVNVLTIKDFYTNYTKIGKCTFIPLVKSIKVEDGSPPPPSSGGGTPPEDKFLMDVTYATINDCKGQNIALDKKQSSGLSYLTKSIKGGTLIYTRTDGSLTEAYIDKSKPQIISKKDSYSIDIKIEMNIKLGRNIDGPRGKDSLTESQKQEIINTVTDDITAAWNICKSTGIDAIQIGEHLYSKHGLSWKDKDNPNYLSLYELGNIEVKLKFY